MSAPRVVHLTTVHRLRDPRIFYKQAATLRAAGLDVVVAAQHPRSETVEGMPVVGLPPAGGGRLGRVRLQHAAYHAARAARPDVLHLHDPELLPLGRLLRRATGARVIYDVHEDYGARGGVGRAIRRVERWALGWLDHVVLADASLRRVVDGADVPVTEIYNYALPSGSPRARTRAASAPLEAVYAGVQARVRGLGTLVDAAAAVRAAGHPCRVTLAGVAYVAADRRWADARIAAHAAAGRPLDGVLLRDGWDRYLAWAAIEAHLRRADVGLALLQPEPRYQATLPTKFYEYLQFGLPIVCSDFPRWRGFVEGQGVGGVVDPADPAAVAEALAWWQAHPEAYDAASARAAALAPRYHWDRMAPRLLAMYEAVLRGRA